MFTARPFAFGALAALLAAGPAAGWTLAFAVVALLAVATADPGPGPVSLFAIPRWAFRACALALRDRHPVARPTLAVAWWRHGQG